MKKLLSVAAMVAALSSCTEIWVGKTAADTALPGAYSVRLITPDLLQPGHIYKVHDGSYTEICGNDISDQRALKAITVVPGTPSPDTVADQARFSDAEVSAFGIKLGPSYQIVKVTGFQIFNAKAPSSTDVASYILANVRNDPKDKDSCGGGVLARNRPYLVVEATVVATKADVTNVKSFSWDGKILGVGGKVGLSTNADSTRTNVVFGAKGRLVTN